MSSVQEKIKQIEFWHEIEKGSRHFVKVVKTDDVLALLEDKIVVEREEYNTVIKQGAELQGIFDEQKLKLVELAELLQNSPVFLFSDEEKDKKYFAIAKELCGDYQKWLKDVKKKVAELTSSREEIKT